MEKGLDLETNWGGVKGVMGGASGVASGIVKATSSRLIVSLLNALQRSIFVQYPSVSGSTLHSLVPFQNMTSFLNQMRVPGQTFSDPEVCFNHNRS